MRSTFLRFAIIFLCITIVPLGRICTALFLDSSVNSFTIFDASESRTIVVGVKEYLIGALFAQIDTDYNIEALKAQAVVAYTNALFEKSKNIHRGFDLEVDISQEILYIDEITAKQKYKDKYQKLLKKVEEAVDSVYGERATYNSKAVLLPYFSSCSGMTEDAYTVWGQEIEYLKPVKSAGDVLNPNSKKAYNFSAEELKNLIYAKYKIDLSTQEISSIAIKGRNRSGTVTECNIGTLTLTGQDLRSLLGLCSANFDITFDNDTITVICYGEGHYVGMSQYGADFMARQGSSYAEILTHYYTGIEIT